MIIKRMARFIREHDWFAVLIEIVVVIVGLMLAFQLDGWVEQRGERDQEAEYVQRLINDLESDIPEIEYAIQLAELRLDMANLLITVSHDPDAAAAKPAAFAAAVHQSAFTYTPTLTSHTFEDLRSTGNMRLLLNLELKDALYEYYGYDENQRQYRPLQFMTEFRHFELAAGILSHEQYVFVQDELYVVSPGELENFDESRMDLDEIRAAAERFRSRSELVDWIPDTRSMQVEQAFTHRDRLERAKTVLDKLRNYAASQFTYE